MPAKSESLALEVTYCTRSTCRHATECHISLGEEHAAAHRLRDHTAIFLLWCLYITRTARTFVIGLAVVQY